MGVRGMGKPVSMLEIFEGVSPVANRCQLDRGPRSISSAIVAFFSPEPPPNQRIKAHPYGAGNLKPMRRFDF